MTGIDNDLITRKGKTWADATTSQPEVAVNLACKIQTMVAGFFELADYIQLVHAVRDGTTIDPKHFNLFNGLQKTIIIHLNATIDFQRVEEFANVNVTAMNMLGIQSSHHDRMMPVPGNHGDGTVTNHVRVQWSDHNQANDHGGNSRITV